MTSLNDIDLFFWVVIGLEETKESLSWLDLFFPGVSMTSLNNIGLFFSAVLCLAETKESISWLDLF